MWPALAKRTQVVASDLHPRRRTMACTREGSGWETQGPPEMTTGNLTEHQHKQERVAKRCDAMQSM